MCTKQQLDRVHGLVLDAKARGGTILCGGAPLGRGYLYPPTIVADVDDSHRIVREEQFGPVLPVLRYSTDEEAIARANNTPYGLGGSVWSPDVEKATAMASRLECGMAWVNQ